MANPEFKLSKKCEHVAFIMDGNGRWANLRGLPRYLGHKAACKKIREVFDACMEFGIRVMSFYAFSTENWNRPQDEIDHLMDYLEDFFHEEIDYLMEKQAQIRITGEIGRIREKTRLICLEAVERTKGNDRFIINICLNHGGRDEIVRAAKKLALEAKEGKLDPEQIDEKLFQEHLDTAGLPDVDLMIRTSGEQRLSNYLLYENAYAEFVFTKVKWPDFGRSALIDCLKEYEGRNRRYGGLKNE